jgi:hypothetical protein
MTERAAILTALVLLLAALGIYAAPECGIPPGDTCTTDMQCACLHGAEE